MNSENRPGMIFQPIKPPSDDDYNGAWIPAVLIIGPIFAFMGWEKLVDFVQSKPWLAWIVEQAISALSWIASLF